MRTTIPTMSDMGPSYGVTPIPGVVAAGPRDPLGAVAPEAANGR